MTQNYTVTHLKTTTSTNDDALALGADGALHLSLVVADAMASGRGRLGRTWQAPAGNVYWSVLVRPERSVTEWSTLGLVAALAVQQVVAGLVNNDVRVKWPNDVLVKVKNKWRKISGILVETAGIGGKNPCAVVGIGINVTAAPAAKEAVFAPICLADLGVDSDVSAIINALCATFLARYNAWETRGFSAELAAYNNVLWQRGAEVRVSLDAAKTQVKTGINEGVRLDGALMVDDEAILVGDVS